MSSSGWRETQARKGRRGRSPSAGAARDSVRLAPGVAALLATDADAVWTLARAPGTGTFSVDWGGPAAASASVDAVSSAATALAREAARAR